MLYNYKHVVSGLTSMQQRALSLLTTVCRSVLNQSIPAEQPQVLPSAKLQLMSVSSFLSSVFFRWNSLMIFFRNNTMDRWCTTQPSTDWMC
jgi:hypothetical protein